MNNNIINLFLRFWSQSEQIPHHYMIVCGVVLVVLIILLIKGNKKSYSLREQIQSQVSQIHSLKIQLGKTKKSYEALDGAIQWKIEEAKMREKKLDEQNTRIRKLSTDLSLIRTELTHNKENFKQAESSLNKKCSNLLNTNKKLEAQLVVSKQELRESNTHNEALNKEIKKLNAELKLNKDKQAESENTIKELTALVEDLKSQIEIQAKEHSTHISSFAKIKENLEQQLTQTKETLMDVQNKVELYESSREETPLDHFFNC